MFFSLLQIAFATPSDLPSGECANNTPHESSLSGKELYEAKCASCHQANGVGEAGFFPPVVNTPWVENPSALTEVMLRGVSGTIYVNEARFASYMSPYGKDLSNEEIHAIVHYVRHTLNSYPQDDTFTVQHIQDIRTRSATLSTIRGQKGLDATLESKQIADPSSAKNPASTENSVGE